MDTDLPGTSVYAAGAMWVAVSAAFGLLFRTLLRRRRLADAFEPVDFSPEKYKPLERLLANDDYDYVAGSDAFSPLSMRRLEAERRRIARQYLKNLREDFNRICLRAKLCLAQGGENRPELAAELLRQRVLFFRTLVAIRWRLAFGGPKGLSAARLVRVVEKLHVRVSSLEFERA